MDIHINLRGDGDARNGLAIMVALLAVVTGQRVDPKACFIGVSKRITVSSVCFGSRSSSSSSSGGGRSSSSPRIAQTHR